jgi:hypothetical protein
MFNFIVKYAPWGDTHSTIPLSRVLNATDDHLVERLRTDGRLDLDALKRLPTLFIQETGASRGEQVARVGRIIEAHAQGKEMALEYVIDPHVAPIPNQVIESMAGELGIGAYEFTTTHWAVKDRDLYRALLRSFTPLQNRPTAFRISEPPNVDSELVSVMMPSDASLDRVYATLKTTVEELGLKCRRADDIWINSVLIQDIVSLIDRSKVVVADCSGKNANVFYEIGIAHTLGRDVIMIAQSADDIPFDLRHHRYVTYLNNRQGLSDLAGALRPKLATYV